MNINYINENSNPFTEGLVAKDIINEASVRALEITNKAVTDTVDYIKNSGDRLGAAAIIAAGVTDVIGTAGIAFLAQPEGSWAVAAKQGVVSAGVVSSLVLLSVGISHMRESLKNHNNDNQ